MDMYQKRKARKEQNSNKQEENSKMNINCLTTVFPILLKNSIK